MIFYITIVEYGRIFDEDKEELEEPVPEKSILRAKEPRSKAQRIFEMPSAS